MRGGEVLGGYGYAEREEYMKRRGELTGEEEGGEGADGESDIELAGQDDG